MTSSFFPFLLFSQEEFGAWTLESGFVADLLSLVLAGLSGMEQK